MKARMYQDKENIGVYLTAESEKEELQLQELVNNSPLGVPMHKPGKAGQDKIFICVQKKYERLRTRAEYLKDMQEEWGSEG